MSLITRIGKGSPLTFQEGDNNLNYLDNFIKQISGSYATTGSNTFIGTQTVIGNLIVFGTSSVSYTTSSTTNIGNNTITVNTSTPSIRFGGLIVFDSGSTNNSGSLLWDALDQHWIYQKPQGASYESGMLISGPKNSTGLGTEQGTLLNVITKGQGEDHITSSALIEDGTTLYVGVNTVITGSLIVTSNIIGTGSYALNALTASYASNVPATSSFAIFSQTASYALNVPATASYAANSNFLDGLDSAAFTTTSSFRAYTSSLNLATASILTTIADIQLTTASIYYFTESINYYTASTTDLISSIQTSTASLNAYTASNSFAVNSTSASFNRYSASINTYTSSLNIVTGSLYRQTASLLSYTASQNILNGKYATTGSNTFKGDQTVQGNFVVTGDIVAQQYIVSSSQIYVTESFSSGSNIFGNSIDDYHVFSGSVLISAGSNVGIGIASPSYQVHTAKAGVNYISIDDTSDNTRLLLGAEINTTTLLSQNPSTTAPVDIKISSGPNEAMRITSGSRIGTGIYPTAKLHAATGSGDLFQLDGNITKVFFVSASGDITTSGSLFRINAPIVSITGSVYSNGPISSSLFNGSGAGLVSVPNSATTATSANTANAIVTRDASGNFTAGTITATLTGNATNISAYTINQNVGSSNSPTFAGLTVNGTINATADIVAYYTSDKRFKSNIQLITDAVAKVNKLNGVTWDWNEDVNEIVKQSPKTGLIAQEVQEVLPEVVVERVDGYLGLDYSKMMGLMVEAIKEQQRQIEELKSRL